MLAPLCHGWETDEDDLCDEAEREEKRVYEGLGPTRKERMSHQDDPRLMTTPEYGAYMARQQGRAEAFEEMKMPYRDRDEFERLESENEELREENDRLRRERDNETEHVKKLREELRDLRSRGKDRFTVTERNELLLEIDAVKYELGAAEAKITALLKSIEEHGQRNLQLRKERGEMTEKLHAAETLRAHAIAVEMVHAHLQDPDWLSNEVALKAIENSGLAARVMELQREREAVEGARKDIALCSPAPTRDLVQLLVGQSRYTTLMPLKHAIAAIRAAVDCWGQEVVEKTNALKGA